MVIRAAERGDTAYVLTWLKVQEREGWVGGVDASWGDRSLRGFTLLMCACDGCHEALADALLRKGADPNLQDSHSRTALMISSARGSHALVLRLLRSGARTNICHANLGDAVAFAEAKGFRLVTELIRTHEASAAGEGTLGVPLGVALLWHCS